METPHAPDIASTGLETGAERRGFAGWSDSRTLIVASIVLAAWVWAIYLPVLDHEFLDYDDAGYVVENADLHDGLTLELVRNAFTKIYLSNWHPLTMLSYGLDVSVFGVESGAMHAVNLVLHTVNVLLLLALCHRLTGSPMLSIFVAGLFAVHPQHVEPVAWLASRKDVLSTAFLLGGLHAYVSYARRRSWIAYGLMLAMIALGLLAKQMLVTAPLLLLLLDYWPLGRLRTRRDALRCVAEKIPLFALSAAMAAAVLWAQTAGGAADTGPLSLKDRLAGPIFAYLHLGADTVAPWGLAAFYPRWTDASMAAVAGGFALLAAVTAGAVGLRRRAPEALFGWLWFVVSLLPVAGFIPLGAAGTADRYAYVPHIGVFLAAGVLAARVPLNASVKGGVAVLVLAACSAVSAWYVPFFRNDITLFERVLSVTEPHVVSLTNLGNGYRARGWYDEAVDHYKEARAMDPTEAGILHNIGIAEARRGAPYAARAAFAEALEMRPKDETASRNVAMLTDAIDTIENELREMETQLAADPDDDKLRELLALDLIQLGLLERGRELYDGRRIPPQLLGLVLEREGQLMEALSAHSQAIAAQPDDPALQMKRIRVLQRAGRREDARDALQELILRFPLYADARQYRRDLGW